MLNTPFSPWPNYSSEEADAIKNLLLSNKVNYWTGNVCQEFEKGFASWIGADYAIALANGTLALEIALRAIGVRSGDEVVVTSRTFVASASAISLVGATPVFADVDPESQNITVETIQAVLTLRTKAIICVHLAGWPCEMDSIMALAKQHKLRVIEDCAQAHGARYKDRSVGSLGDIAAWSFCQDKIMTTGGEGGMVTTNDPDLWSFMWSYKDHGKSWTEINSKEPQSGFRWLHHHLGTNARMLEIQAQIGCLQLRKMPEWHQKRLANAKRIWETACQLKGLRVPPIPNTIEHAAYKCYVFVVEEQLVPGWNRDRILETINALGVPCYYGSCSEVYLEKAFSNARPKGRLQIVQKLGKTSLMFLVHPNLTEQEITLTCTVLEEVMAKATGNKLIASATNLIQPTC